MWIVRLALRRPRTIVVMAVLIAILGVLSITRTPTDIRNWRNERALSDFNREHVLTMTGVWELPFADKQKGFIGRKQLRLQFAHLP